MYYFFKRTCWGNNSREEKILKIPELTLHTEARKKELFKGKLIRKILEGSHSQHLNNTFLLITWSFSRTAWSTLEAFSFILHQIRDFTVSLLTSKNLNLFFWPTLIPCPENTFYLIRIHSSQPEPVHHCSLWDAQSLLSSHPVVHWIKDTCAYRPGRWGWSKAPVEQIVSKWQLTSSFRAAMEWVWLGV